MSHKMTIGVGLLGAVNALMDNSEQRKQKILTELYSTGRLDGLYFGRKSRSTNNPVKFYIKSCMYKQRCAPDESIVDDCYNEAFEYMQRKSAAKLCAMYDTNPAKVIATLLTIISLKCFAKDPRYGNPKHSLFQSMLHTSGLGGAYIIDPSETYKDIQDSQVINNMFDDSLSDIGYSQNYILKSDAHELSEFENQYGFSVEDVIERLTPEERLQFYEVIGKQPRGKVSGEKLQVREALFVRVSEIRRELSGAK